MSADSFVRYIVIAFVLLVAFWAVVLFVWYSIAGLG